MQQKIVQSNQDNEKLWMLAEKEVWMIEGIVMDLSDDLWDYALTFSRGSVMADTH